jgi:hypothetical protein
MKRLVRTLIGVVAAAAMLSWGGWAAAAHSPDPVVGGALYAQNQDLAYRWMAGEVPPSKMQSPINAAADDANDSRASRAPTLRYSSGGSSTVEYGTSVPCGVNGLACFDRSNAPNSFRVAFREHGHRFDWGTLRWCQMLASFTNGCYDVENIALDELGHVLVLNHHGNYADDRDYRDAVVQTYSRVRPQDGWNAHVFGRCDVATLQTKYDMQMWESAYSTCLNLDTTLGFRASATSITAGTTITFTANLSITDLDAYGRLGGNPVSSRSVVLQRRVPGVSTWTTLSALTPAYGGVYRINQSPITTYDWRVTFAKPGGEGIQGSSSSSVRVTVSGCTSPCPLTETARTEPAAGGR